MKVLTNVFLNDRQNRDRDRKREDKKGVNKTASVDRTTLEGTPFQVSYFNSGRRPVLDRSLSPAIRLSDVLLLRTVVGVLARIFP